MSAKKPNFLNKKTVATAIFATLASSAVTASTLNSPTINAGYESSISEKSTSPFSRDLVLRPASIEKQLRMAGHSSHSSHASHSSHSSHSSSSWK